MRNTAIRVGLVFAAFALSSCADSEKELYLLEEVRTPVLQFYEQVDASVSEGRVGCIDLDVDDDALAEKWCQQFPLRPEAAVLVRMVGLSPPGGLISASITSIRQFVNLPLGVSRGARLSVANEVNSTEVLPETLSFQARPKLARTLIEDPMRLQEFYFTMQLPTVDDLFAGFEAGGSLPGYTITYEATSPDHKNDRGAVSFIVLPDPAKSDIYDSLLNQAGDARISLEVVNQIREQARTNTPPEMSELMADASAARKDNEMEISFTLKGDPDDDSKQRVQWFITNGELEAEVSAKTKWIPKKSGDAGLIAVVRDLQGGVDFQFRTLTVAP